SLIAFPRLSLIAAMPLTPKTCISAAFKTNSSLRSECVQRPDIAVCCPGSTVGNASIHAESAAHLQGTGIDNVGGRALDEVDDIVKCRTKIHFIAVLLDIANMRRADAVFEPSHCVDLQNGFCI